MPTMIHICCLVLWKISMQFATSVSMTETQEVSAAKASIRKNAMPMIRPNPPMASNTFGREIKVRLGPEAIPSVPRNTNTAGMIIIPDRKATPVSNSSI